MADNLYEEIVRNMKIEIGANFEKAFNKLDKSASKKIGKIIERSIKNHPTYIQLASGGTAYHQFGVPDIKARMDNIIKVIVSQVKFDYDVKKFNKTSSIAYFNFKITILDLDFQSILASEAATFTTEKGYELDWLEWLLFEGVSPVILDYRYKPRDVAASRTGLGIMVPKGSWAVPPSLAGTSNDNWITQAVYEIDQEINEIAEQAIADAFN